MYITTTAGNMERNLWRDSEIKGLLNIIEKERILTMINEKKFRNEQIFRFVESEMYSRGFTKKNYQQIWTKWKFLKSSYVTTKRHNSVPGNTPRTCDHYYLLDRILGDCPTISAVHSGIDGISAGGVTVKQEIEDTESDSASMDPEPELEPEPEPEPLPTPVIPAKNIAIETNGFPKVNHRIKIKTTPPKRESPEQISFNDDFDEEPSTKRKPQGSYFRAMKDLANNLRQMQRELIDEFFKKQEDLMREEHEFQKHQDEILLKSFEEQTRLLLDGARNLLSSGVSEMPDIVYINED